MIRERVLVALKDVLSEMNINHYKALVRVTHNPELTMSEIADRVRSLPEVTIVTNVSHDEKNGIAVYSVKVLTSKKPREAYETLRKNAIKFPDISKCEIGFKTIESIGTT